jgi:6-phosphogluconate dehydrogenase
MMQAIAEGFEVLKKARYKLNLKDVARIYNNGSVIDSRLIKWLSEAFELHTEDLKGVSGTVAHTGEGAWTVKAAQELKVKAKIIDESLKFRILSKKNPKGYTGKVLSALREQFGGHKVI